MNTIVPKYTTHCPQGSAAVFKALPSGYINVDKYLIRGPHPSIKDLMQLKSEGVNQIFDFRHLSNFGCKFIEKLSCRLLGIKYTRLPYSNLYGEYPDLDVFQTIAANVKQNGENGGKTLFHCNSGRHRTSHFAAFYALTKGEPLESVKARNKDSYGAMVNKVAKEQIYDRGYFSRSRKEYHGYNPIRRLLVKYNNRIFDGIENAQQIFLGLLNS